MAHKPALSIDKLTELGTEKLARLVLDEAERNTAFRRLVNAALAGRKGPGAIARIIDRQLGALEKARSRIAREKSRGFYDGLAATLAAIGGDLAEASPMMAIERLLRFIATYECVADRVSDSSGRVWTIYDSAVSTFESVMSKLQEHEAAFVPDLVTSNLADTRASYLVRVAESLSRHLPEAHLRSWNSDLTDLQKRLEKVDAQKTYVYSSARQYRQVRQIIADRLGDLDGLIAIEEELPPDRQNTAAIAGRLLAAGRPAEALAWIRRKQPTPGGDPDMLDLIGRPGDTPALQHVLLEARILEALERKVDAQALRWSTFETSLSPEILRAYISALPDFEEFDAVDRALAHVMASQSVHKALAFLVTWPKLDLAAELVITKAGLWDGGRYLVLPPWAETLENDHPLAASVLYRALIDASLAQGNSKAYVHAARYLDKLDQLDARSSEKAATTNSIATHAQYRAELRRVHGRKYGFWTRVKQK